MGILAKYMLVAPERRAVCEEINSYFLYVFRTFLNPSVRSTKTLAFIPAFLQIVFTTLLKFC